jgi:hypothetical protein
MDEDQDGVVEMRCDHCGQWAPAKLQTDASSFESVANNCDGSTATCQLCGQNFLLNRAKLRFRPGSPLH